MWCVQCVCLPPSQPTLLAPLENRRGMLDATNMVAPLVHRARDFTKNHATPTHSFSKSVLIPLLLSHVSMAVCSPPLAGLKKKGRRRGFPHIQGKQRQTGDPWLCQADPTGLKEFQDVWSSYTSSKSYLRFDTAPRICSQKCIMCHGFSCFRLDALTFANGQLSLRYHLRVV